MPATVIDHTDVGAPVLSGLAGALYGVLKWALPQLGWTIEFDNSTDKIVFRNSSTDGSGSYLRIDDSITGAADVRMYDTMSDIDTGTNGTLSVFTSRWAKSDGATSAARGWRIIGDKKRFYFIVAARTADLSSPLGSASTQLVYFAGDIVSRAPLAHEAILTAENTTSGAQYGAFPWSSVIASIGSSMLQFVLGADGLSKGTNGRGFGTSASGAVIASGIGASGAWADPISGDVNISYAWIADEQGVRGRLPGVFFPDGDLFVDASNVQFASYPSAGTPEGTLDLVSLMSNGGRSSGTKSFGFLLALASEDWADVS